MLQTARSYYRALKSTIPEQLAPVAPELVPDVGKGPADAVLVFLLGFGTLNLRLRSSKNE